MKRPVYKVKIHVMFLWAMTSRSVVVEEHID